MYSIGIFTKNKNIIKFKLYLNVLTLEYYGTLIQ